ncbi:MAG TPA: site-specific integrase [Nitrososphaeraceae archaeon]
MVEKPHHNEIITKTSKRRTRGAGRPPNPKTLHPLETAPSFQNFKDSLVTFSKDSQENYVRWLCKYMIFCKVGNNTDSLLFGGNGKQIEYQIKEFFIYQRNKANSSQNSLHVYYHTIKRFYDFNDILNINWSRIKSYVGKNHGSKSLLRPYTREEIRKILQVADKRERVIVLLMCSAGLRVGAIPELKIGDLKYIPEQGIYRIVSYSESESNHRYVTWCTPECANAIQEYLSFRQQCGEVIKDRAPVIRKEFNKTSKTAASNPKKVNVHSVERLVYYLAYDAGIRTRDNMVSRLGDRHETSRCHSLRRFFKTQCTSAGVDQLWSKLFLGHGAAGSLEGRYDIPNEDMLFKAYVKAIPNLTIGTDEETRLKEKIKQSQERENYIIQMQQQQIEEMRAKMDRYDKLEQQFESLNKRLLGMTNNK